VHQVDHWLRLLYVSFGKSIVVEAALLCKIVNVTFKPLGVFKKIADL
jgi:hypothetical protein